MTRHYSSLLPIKLQTAKERIAAYTPEDEKIMEERRLMAWSIDDQGKNPASHTPRGKNYGR